MTSPSADMWLRPSLLDRLTDALPLQRKELASQQVDGAELRALIRRDLSWLFNTTQLAASLDLSDFPAVARSVLNFGIPDLTGRTLSSLNQEELAADVVTALRTYESRLDADSIRVHVLAEETGAGRPTLFIEIEADLLVQPLPVALRLRAEVDLESGRVAVTDDLSREEG